MEITRQVFKQQRHPRYGTANPERMQFEYWEWMVRRGFGPYRIRELLSVDHQREHGPDWCFDRMGATQTELPDGRIVYVGGEHEDHYDAHFCIYNDVVVVEPTGNIEIYGYPEDVFAPTDFHTATLAYDRLVLVGSFGYPGKRLIGFTPVYTLELTTYRMEKSDTSGESPGWLSNHSATYDPVSHEIQVRNGETIEMRDGREICKKNVEEFRLRLDDGCWRRTTDRRNWRQFQISRTGGGGLDTHKWNGEEIFCPNEIPYQLLPKPDWGVHRIAVDGVSIKLFEHHHLNILILFQGSLPDAITQRVVTDILSNVEKASNHKCLLLEL